MNCTAQLIRPSDMKVLKVDSITKDTYKDCEIEILARNLKEYKDGRYWKIISINKNFNFFNLIYLSNKFVFPVTVDTVETII